MQPKQLQSVGTGIKATLKTHKGGVAYAVAALVVIQKGWQEVLIYAAWEEIMFRDIFYDFMKWHVSAGVQEYIDFAGGAGTLSTIAFALFHMHGINMFSAVKIMSIYYLSSSACDVTKFYDNYGIYACIILHFSLNYAPMNAAKLLVRKVADECGTDTIVKGNIPFETVLACVSKELRCSVSMVAAEANTAANISFTQQYEATPERDHYEKYGWSRVSQMCKMVRVLYVQKETGTVQAFPPNAELIFPECLLDIYLLDKSGFATDDIKNIIFENLYTDAHAMLLFLHYNFPAVLPILGIQCPFVNRPNATVMERIQIMCGEAPQPAGTEENPVTVMETKKEKEEM